MAPPFAAEQPSRRNFEWVQGEEAVTFYESSPGNRKGFCRVCGSPILSKFDDHPNYFGLPLGALDDDPRIRPKLHTHVASKASSFTITDDLPQIRGETSASASKIDSPLSAVPVGHNEHAEYASCARRKRSGNRRDAVFGLRSFATECGAVATSGTICRALRASN